VSEVSARQHALVDVGHQPRRRRLSLSIAEIPPLGLR
jgi:hypothetical protein